jgi:VanZ family protein
MDKVTRALSIWLPPLALMGLIFVLSAMPSDDVDRGLAYFLARKLGHFTEYALLTALWWRALRTGLATRAAVVLSVVVSVAYAATDELHQSTVEGRHGTPVDVLIDSAGALTAAGLIVRRRSKLPA